MLPPKAMLSVWDSFTVLLESIGLSATWLFVGTAIFMVVLLLAMREFLCWYLRIYETQKMIADLKAELSLHRTKSPEPVLAPTKTEPLIERPVDRFVHYN